MSNEGYTMSNDSLYEYDSASDDKLTNCEFFLSTTADELLVN